MDLLEGLRDHPGLCEAGCEKLSSSKLSCCCYCSGGGGDDNSGSGK